MTTTTTTTTTRTPSETWEIFVGDQSRVDFLLHSASSDPAEAVAAYIDECRTWFAGEDVDAIAAALVAHIEADAR